MRIKLFLLERYRINDEITEIRIETRKVDAGTSESLLQENKENIQSLHEILRPKETRIFIPSMDN